MLRDWSVEISLAVGVACGAVAAVLIAPQAMELGPLWGKLAISGFMLSAFAAGAYTTDHLIG